MENNHFNEYSEPSENKTHEIIPVSGLYRNWFLDYASYVILERAVPAIEDGLKPVQRRILHAMREMEDGRFNKVANIIGQAMQYHPHGDAAIGDAMVNLGQKELLIETQGNWGDIRTGDGAAAPRYIEARLSKFALETVFNSGTTRWQLSYDGRKKEPVTLPVKFPLLLAQGVEGIAVGLATKIMAHNFCELLEASVDILKGKKVSIFPDFPTGGMVDVTNYNEGQKGGKLRIRAKIEEIDTKTLVIRDIPFGTTTSSLIDSIVKAGENGKIKIKKVVDNTARDVEIIIYLAPGTSPDVTIDALYAFTECEVSVSPNACVIVDEKPQFLSVNEILSINTQNTVELLRRELEIRRGELLEDLLFSSLEKIFIENKIYRDIEECETWEAVLSTIDLGLEPFKPQFYREITRDDIIRLTEIKIKRISKFDSFKADEAIRKLSEDLAQTEHHLANLTEYAVSYFKDILKKYGKGRERKTEIRQFDTIAVHTVAAANLKLYVNRKDGFVGYGLKKEEYVCDCSDLDDIIAFRRNGTCVISKVSEKLFMGKDLIHVGVFRKNDERMVYNMAYTDGKTGVSYVKRFQVLAVTRDREYVLTKDEKGSKVLYFSANPNGEAEVVSVTLTPGSKARNKIFDFDFKELEIKGRSAAGNILTKYSAKKITLKEQGISTLGGTDIWYDAVIGRLNTDGRGTLLGNFSADDKILSITSDGCYELTGYELTNRYDGEKTVLIEKFDPERIISAVYYNGDTKFHYVKRFKVEAQSTGKRFCFIGEHKSSKLFVVSSETAPQIEIKCRKNKESVSLTVCPNDLIDVKGWKAQGNKLSNYPVTQVKLIVLQDKKITSDASFVSETEKQEKSKNAPAQKKSKASLKEEVFSTGDVIELDPGEQLGLFGSK